MVDGSKGDSMFIVNNNLREQIFNGRCAAMLFFSRARDLDYSL
jgi:hypothetical protein